MEHKLGAAEDGQRELTIRWDPETDDPMGFLYGWIAKGYLESFLRVFPKPATGGIATDADDAYHLAVGLNWLAEHADRRLEFLLLLLRDQYKASWGTLGAALDGPRSSAKTRYTSVAKDYAKGGNYVDESGLQSGPPAEVMELVAARLKTREAQEKINERAVANLKTGDRVSYRRDTKQHGTAVRTALGSWIIDWDAEGELLTPLDDIIPLTGDVKRIN